MMVFQNGDSITGNYVLINNAIYIATDSKRIKELEDKTCNVYLITFLLDCTYNIGIKGVKNRETRKYYVKCVHNNTKTVDHNQVAINEKNFILNSHILRGLTKDINDIKEVLINNINDSISELKMVKTQLRQEIENEKLFRSINNKAVY